MLYINRESGIPIYQQLYSQFTEQITSGILRTGEKLPSIRDLSGTLCISVNIIKMVYFQLVLEGFVYSRPGSGYFVEDVQLDIPALQTIDRPILIKTNEIVEQKALYDFQYGNLHPSSFPSGLWLRYTKEILYSHGVEAISQYGDKQGDYELRYQIARYLRQVRSVNCVPEQIIMTCGMQYSIGVVARLTGDKTVAFEDPGYNIARREFLNHCLSVVPVPVREDGIDLRELAQSNTGLVYITPSHQFPMGYVMPMANRFRILVWAEKQNAYILEDDYDCELRYHQQPIPALQGISNGNRVIYMGTFSKLLSPALRMSYLVLPPVLLALYNKIFEGTYCQCSWLQQRVLSEFIKDGQWERQIRRLVTGNCKKHDLLLNNLRRILPESARIHGINAGTHLVLELNDCSCAKGVMNKAASQGIRIYGTQNFWMNPTKAPRNMLLLGYTGLTKEDIQKAISLFENA